MKKEIKIRKSILEKYIIQYSSEIQKMGDNVLPDVMFELQAEELNYCGVPFSKEKASKIDSFSEHTLREVFHCWFGKRRGNLWLEKMKEEEKLAA